MISHLSGTTIVTLSTNVPSTNDHDAIAGPSSASKTVITP